MVSDISNWLSSAPHSSRLQAPASPQRISDFASNDTIQSFQEEELQDQGIDWSRMRDLELVPPSKKKLHSFIWEHGWRMAEINTGTEYWACRHCHYSAKQPRNPMLLKTNATSLVITHLRVKHRLNANSHVASPPPRPSNQSSLDGFTTSSIEAPAFNLSTFKALLLRLVTTEQLPFKKLESDAFKELLIYLQPRLQGAIPSRRSIRRLLGEAYDRSQASVEQALRQATTRINLSFDLWSSPGRRLALLGVVAHYLDANYQPQTVLLSLPRVSGKHTAKNLASKLTEILLHFDLTQSFGYTITDNASENTACMNQLSEAFMSTRASATYAV